MISIFQMIFKTWNVDYMGQVKKLRLSCYLVLLSIDSKTRQHNSHSFVTWPIYSGNQPSLPFKQTCKTASTVTEGNYLILRMFTSPFCHVVIIWIWTNCTQILVNSLRPSDAYMCQWTRPSLIQIMACRLTGAKPLSEPMMGYCLLDPWGRTNFSEILIGIQTFSLKKIQLKMSSGKWWPFCLGLDVLSKMWSRNVSWGMSQGDQCRRCHCWYKMMSWPSYLHNQIFLYW